MKRLTKFVLAAAMLITTLTAEAGWVSGYYHSNGTYGAPHIRTAPNWTPTDNLSYRGYGTVRVPRY